MTTQTERQNRLWNKKMSAAEMLSLMTDEEIRKNARRGGVACIEEMKRRKQEKWENDLKAMKITPPAALDIGV